jgi:beta-carotene/zeaxanthin 4-ketolase
MYNKLSNLLKLFLVTDRQSLIPPKIRLNQRADSAIGIAIAITIIGFWIISLVLLLPLPLSQVPWIGIFLAVTIRSFLHTGLFILAHDAIHASLVPNSKLINRAIGRLAIWLYAFFPYEECRTKHWQHHRHPAQVGDPDFHDGIDDRPIFWYLKFMREYLPFWQMVRFIGNFSLIWGITSYVWDINLTNLLIFWILPLSISSIQLFLFGTYLPHREHHARSSNLHRARSSQDPIWWSFLTCYHFGYHWEHHEYPQTPWYRLPAMRWQDSNKVLPFAIAGNPIHHYINFRFNNVRH